MRHRPALRGSLALAALAADGWSLTARAAFDPVTDTDLWSDFATDGRLAQASPARADAPTAGPAGAALCCDDDARSGRAAGHPVRPGLGPADGRVRGGPALVEALYPRLGAELGRGPGTWRVHALRQAPAWRTAIEAWQAPILEDAARPAWYRAALFNELYFLVDGGTFWEAGEVGGAAAGTRRPGRFALLECVDYPFYDTVDVDFYASFAILELFPELELRGIRDLLATIPVDDPTIGHDRGVRACPASARSAGPCRTTSAGPADDPFLRPNWYRFQDVNGWKDLGPEVRAPGLARRRGRRRAGRRRPHPRRLPDRRRPDDAGCPRPIATTTACPSTTASPTRPTTPGRCTGRRPTAGRYGWRRPRPPRRWPGGSVMARPRPRRSGWFERGQVAFDRRLWRGRYYAYDDGGGAELRQRSWPTSWPASGTRMRPASATSCPRTGSRPPCGRSTP